MKDTEMWAAAAPIALLRGFEDCHSENLKGLRNVSTGEGN